MNETKEMEKDYCGYEDFAKFCNVVIELPNDLVEEIERLDSIYPKYGKNGTYALLLRKGLTSIYFDADIPQD